MQSMIENYKKLLFTYPSDNEDYHTYAIVDSIKDEAIKEKIIFSTLKNLDLWDDVLAENEVEVPLYLIELKEEDTLLEWLLSRHHKVATIYLQSMYDIETLQSHYSGYTFPYIEIEAKGYEEEIPRGIFGFYDPKVFPRFMKTLYTQEKKERFFAGAPLFFIPSVSKPNLCELYYLNVKKQIALKPWQTDKTPPVITQEKRYVNPQAPYYEIHTIDERQVEILETLSHERFVKEVLVELKSEAKLEEEIDKIFEHVLERSIWAREHLGIESQANMARFIQISLLMPKALEYYAQSNEFKALRQTDEQLEKREILQTLMQKLNLQEVA